MGVTRVFFTSDVHGSEICFMKFISAAKYYKADVIIRGALINLDEKSVRNYLLTQG
jgi:Icc-related predicted phosphoesterase